MPTTTTTYSFNKPVVGADEDDWGGYLNGNWDSVDDLLDGTTPVTGIDINSGTLDGITSFSMSSGNATFADNSKAIFGAGSDLQIYHNGSNSYIDDAGDGALLIRSNEVRLNKYTGEYMLRAFADGAVSLYYDQGTYADPKLSTTSTGVDITGTLTSDGLTVEDATEALITLSDTSHSNQRMKLTHGSSSGAIEVGNNGAYGNFNLKAWNGTSSVTRMNVNNSGDISFYEDTGTTAKFFWDASAEQVQIGSSFGATTTPLLIEGSSYDPTANGGINSGGITIRGGTSALGNNTGALVFAMNKGGASAGSAGISGFQEANNDDQLGLAFFTHGSSTATNPAVERMRIDSSGNVGIGTSSIDYTAANRTVVHIEGSSGALLAMEDTGAKSYLFQSGNDLFVENDTTTGSLVFGTNASTERMRIDSSGNVGIGTSSIGARITLGDASSTDSTNMIRSYRGGGTSTYAEFGEGSGGAKLEHVGGGPVYFKTGGSEAMRIDSSGNLLVGKTTTDIGTQGILIKSSGRIEVAKTSATTLFLNRLTSDGNIAEFRKDGTTVGSIQSVSGVVSNIILDPRSAVKGSGLRGASSDASEGLLLPIDNAGNLADGTITLGQPSSRFKDLYLSGGLRGDTTFKNNAGTTEYARFDSSGNLLVGTTSQIDSALVSVDAGSGKNGITVDVDHPSGGFTNVFLDRTASDGTFIAMNRGAASVGSIGSEPTGNSDLFIGNGDTGIVFHDGNDAIMPYNTSTGSFRDNAIDLGFFNQRWDDVYATNGTIQTSDRNEKQDIAELSDAEQRVAVAAKGLLRKFRWRDAVEEKGDEARTHFGIIAQDLQAAFAAEGLDAGDYAMFIHSTWTDEETGEERSRMGVRYSELLAFIIAAI